MLSLICTYNLLLNCGQWNNIDYTYNTLIPIVDKNIKYNIIGTSYIKFEHSLYCKVHIRTLVQLSLHQYINFHKKKVVY